MERKYWIGRMDAAMRMARGAASSESRLAHYELAGRYSIKAAASRPFLHAPSPDEWEPPRLASPADPPGDGVEGGEA